MDDLKALLLIQFKQLKGITDDNSDDVFLFAIETAINDILIYCNLDILDWPIGLNHTAVLMALDNYNQATMSINFDSNGGEFKTLKEGDFSITTETKAEAFKAIASGNSLAKNYKAKLNHYRKLG
ncbi:hypothetical protein AAK938_01315 [Aerococcaceae bacterium 50-4]